MGLSKRQIEALLSADKGSEIPLAAKFLVRTQLELIEEVLQKSSEGVLAAIKDMNDRRMTAIGSLKAVTPVQCSSYVWNAVQDAIEVLE